MSRVEERLKIEGDGSIVAYSGKVDYGQGLHAAYPRIVAAELGISPSEVRVVLGETDLVPWDMGTFGSMSVEMDGLELRRAAAYLRSALIERAAVGLRTPATSLEIVSGGVRRVVDGQTISFAELVASGPLTGEIPDDVVLAPTVLAEEGGEGRPDLFARDVVTGRAEFVGDVRIAGMLEGAVLHPARNGAVAASIDREAALLMPGVVAVVHEGDFIGVVAQSHAQALAARAALKPVWRNPAAKTGAPTSVPLRHDEGVDDAMSKAATRVSARYFTPHITAAPIGPSVGLADVGATDAVVYGSTQVPFRLREQVAAIAGLPAVRVHVHPRAMSGGYGRHGASDAAVEAARLSKSVGRPVRVQWGRDDELHGAPNRAQMTAELEGALDRNGKIVAWRWSILTNPYDYEASGVVSAPPPPSARPAAAAAGGAWSSPGGRAAMMAGRNGVPPYEVGRGEMVLNLEPATVRTGALRSLGAAPNVFASESFMDELAQAAGKDPIAFRLDHTRDARLKNVLEVVRARSGWRDGGRLVAKAQGFGVACVIYRNTYVAQVVEVAVGASGVVRVERVWCAVDAGHIVHPDGARNQVEGAVQMAASWALLESLPHKGGEVTGATWADYPIATFRDAPKSIDVVFTGDDTQPSSGLGEPPAVPVAPAIANAVFAACGVRVRELPIRTPAP